LRSAYEHLDEVVVQCVVELALKTPFELRVVEVAGMEIEIIGVHRNRGVFEFDDYFNAIALGSGREVQQRVLVEAQLGQDSIEARGSFRHREIVKQSGVLKFESRMPERQPRDSQRYS
jgi:hypothetical protein